MKKKTLEKIIESQQFVIDEISEELKESTYVLLEAHSAIEALCNIIENDSEIIAALRESIRELIADVEDTDYDPA